MCSQRLPGYIINHLFDIPMIGSNDYGAAFRFHCVNHFADASIERFDSVHMNVHMYRREISIHAQVRAKATPSKGCWGKCSEFTGVDNAAFDRSNHSS